MNIKKPRNILSERNESSSSINRTIRCVYVEHVRFMPFSELITLMEPKQKIGEKKWQNEENMMPSRRWLDDDDVDHLLWNYLARLSHACVWLIRTRSSHHTLNIDTAQETNYIHNTNYRAKNKWPQIIIIMMEYLILSKIMLLGINFSINFKCITV